MKRLDYELRITNHVFMAIKAASGKHLDKYNLTRCWKCKGTGLSNVQPFDGTFSWTGEYCKTCKGTGLIGKLEDYLQLPLGENHHMYICKHCLGKGCKQCNYIGLIDWLQRITNPSRSNNFKEQTNGWYL